MILIPSKLLFYEFSKHNSDLLDFNAMYCFDFQGDTALVAVDFESRITYFTQHHISGFSKCDQ